MNNECVESMSEFAQYMVGVYIRVLVVKLSNLKRIVI